MLATKKLLFPKDLWARSLLALIVAGVVFGCLEISGVTHVIHKKVNYGSGVIPAQTSTGSSKLIPSTSTDSGASSNSAKISASQPNDSGPVAPTGTFVSNHRPNLNGSPYPSQEQSTCNTSVGASCHIVFTNGSITKKLDAQMVNRNGAAFWVWDVKTAGFSEGTWQIQAVATFNGVSKTSSDPINLEIGP